MTIMGNTCRVCANCKEIKPSSQFADAPSGKDGKDNYCKRCRREYLHQYYLEHKQARDRTRINHTCKTCGIGFHRSGREEYCSDECKAGAPVEPIREDERIYEPSICFGCEFLENCRVMVQELDPLPCCPDSLFYAYWREKYGEKPEPVRMPDDVFVRVFAYLERV